MDRPGRKKRSAPRSRAGCLPCRRHHRKCDEQRPVCELCRKNGRTCDYGLSIKWGGRPFQKSTFGQCLSGARSQIGRIRTVDEAAEDVSNTSRITPPFIYGIIRPVIAEPAAVVEQEHSPWPENQTGQDLQQQGLLSASEDETTHPHVALMLARRAPDIFPELPPAYKSLLDYFTHAVDSFSCDEVVKRDFCSTFLPMAFDTSHVMASMLNLAAVHRTNAGLSQNSKQLALLQVVSVEQLRSRLSNTITPPSEAVMATILMLCYSEIVAGGKKAHSWRLHLEGAASLFNRDLSAWTTLSPNPTRAFIARCFVSLVALANMSGCPPSESVSRQALYMAGGHNETDSIDEFTAYSADLLHTFVEIGGLLRERECISYSRDTHGSSSMEERCSVLIRKLSTAARRRHARMEDRVFAVLSPVRKAEFININEAYHQAALLHIHQRIRRLPSTSFEIQEIVQRILALISGVEFLNGPCPGIVLLFPLFSAGCGAVRPTDRQQVRSLLHRMVRMYQIVAVQHSIKVLEALWSHRDEYGESETNTSWETFIDGDIDLILY